MAALAVFLAPALTLARAERVEVSDIKHSSHFQRVG
jgi:hypothetical protein